MSLRVFELIRICKSHISTYSKWQSGTSLIGLSKWVEVFFLCFIVGCVGNSGYCHFVNTENLNHSKNVTFAVYGMVTVENGVNCV